MSEEKIVDEVYVAITKVTGGYVINTAAGTRVLYSISKVIELVEELLTNESL